jgi:Uma2 family endonuclease
MSTVSLAAEQQVEQKVVLQHVSWETYQSLLRDFSDSHAAHFFYDRGTLEIMVLSLKHESLNRAIAALIEIVAETLELDFANVGSTTFKREDLKRGFEPDTAFYFQNASLIRSKDEINLSFDPPPDLILEIDITHPSLDKLPIYAAVGVPEVWRFDGKELMIFALQNNGYVKQNASAILPAVTGAKVFEFIEHSKTMTRPEWLRDVREYARGLSPRS